MRIHTVTWVRPIIALCFALAAFAHPMGNFSVSHYTRITPAAGGLSVVHALDLAEIPTFELLRDWKLDADSPMAELEKRAGAQAREWVKGLRFTVNGRAVTPRLERSELAVADGAGGLKVFRITAYLKVAAREGRLEFEDRNFEGRAGWKEIVIDPGTGVAVARASHSSGDRSRALASYPDDLSAPPQDLRASLEWTAAPAAAASTAPVIVPVPQPSPPASAGVVPPPATAPPAPQPAGTVVKGDFLSTLLSKRDLSLWMILTGLGAAFVLGAAHAFTPGHGKTMVAAYLVGSRGTARHAVLLGATVTFTHTISVFALGLVTLFLAQYVVPDKLIKILELISGVSIVLIGGSLLYKRIGAMRAHTHHLHHHHHHDGHHHHHGDDHHHYHHGHSHDHDHSHGHLHGPDSHSHTIEGDVTLASLIALGASGGLVPCPSALVLMLSAVAVGRTAFGLSLLVLFSLGLAIVLTGIGLAVVYAKHLIPDSKKTAEHPAFRLVPVVSAAVIVCIGLLMTGVALGWISPRLAV